MWVWRALLRISAQQHPQSGHTALDSTFFDRRAASSYYHRLSRKIVLMFAISNIESLCGSL
jgi:hypothetical protein